MSGQLARVIEEHRVACLTTNSLREILKLFVGDREEYSYLITELRARASNLEDMKPTVEDKVYGIKGYCNVGLDLFQIDYKLKFKKGKPVNPIDISGRELIYNALDRVGIEDASVELVKVLIKDPEIGRLAGIDEEWFHMTLISDPVDGDLDREKVKEHPVNHNLIKYNKFKYRILHCRKLIDRKQELTVPRRRQRPIILWLGKTVHSLRSPIKIAQHIKDAHFGEYKLIKRYGVGKEDRLILLGVSR